MNVRLYYFVSFLLFACLLSSKQRLTVAIVVMNVERNA